VLLVAKLKVRLCARVIIGIAVLAVKGNTLDTGQLAALPKVAKRETGAQVEPYSILTQIGNAALFYQASKAPRQSQRTNFK
jgi:hypothetical protein